MNQKIVKELLLMISIIYLSYFSSFSQDSTGFLPKYSKYVQSDSLGIDFSNFLVLRMYLKINRDNYTFTDEDKNKWKYKSNPRPSLGLGFSYRKLTVNAGINLPYILDKKNNFGETNNLFIDMNFTFSKYSLSILSSIIKGYYYDQNDFIELRPDIEKISSSIYLFRHRLESEKPLRMIYFNDALVNKTEGAFINGYALHLNFFKGDSSVFDKNVAINEAYKIQNYGAVYLIGYTKCWIFNKKFYTVASLMGGAGLGLNRYVGNESNSFIAVVSEGRYQVGAGFNSYRCQFGGYLDGFVGFDKSIGAPVYILQNQLVFKLVFAYRFLPKWLKKIDPYFDKATKIQKELLK